MDDLQELIKKESSRYRILRYCYTKLDGNTLACLDTESINNYFIEHENMSREEVELAYNYLQNENLLKTVTDQETMITHSGVKEIEASIKYPDKSTSHFSTQAIQVVIHQKVVMGDNFEGISDSTIVNHSSVENAFNKVKNEYDEETANALKQIEKEINNSNNREAAESFESFSDELSKPQPKKFLLKTLWKGTLEALPRLAQLTSIVSNVEKLF